MLVVVSNGLGIFSEKNVEYIVHSVATENKRWQQFTRHNPYFSVGELEVHLYIFNTQNTPTLYHIVSLNFITNKYDITI